MKRIVSLFLVLTVASVSSLSGCTPAKPAAKKPVETPYTFDYKTDKRNAGFFVKGDTYNTLKAASPFYGGAQAFPSGRAGEFEKLRAAKVAQIMKEADTIVKRT